MRIHLLPKLLLVTSAFLTASSAFAADPEFVQSKTSGRIIFAKGDGTTRAPDVLTQANNFVSTAAATLGVGATTLQATRESEDKLGMTHLSFTQKYRRIPVYGGEVAVHINKDTTLSSAGATLSTDLRVKSAASMTSTKAARIAIKAWQKEFDTLARPTVESVNQFVLDKNLIQNKAGNAPYLVWEITLGDGNAIHGYRYYVDANSVKTKGKFVNPIVWKQSVAKFDNPTPIDRKVYDCSQPAPPGNRSTCPVMTINSYTYGRVEGSLACGPNPNYMPAQSFDVNNLYDKLNGIRNFYWDTFGRNGASNQGGTGDGDYLPTRTYGVTYSDYTPGWACPNAVMGKGVLSFCKDLIVDDITAHEYAHAVVLYKFFNGGTAVGTTYSGESGALDESHSDVMGEMFERYRTGSNNWIMGSSAPFGPAYERSLADPPSRTAHGYTSPYSDRYNAPNYYCGSGDNGGVHLNSTVPSKAAYLMSQGGSFNGCTVNGIGPDKMSQILYRAVVQYYAQTETFNGAFYKQIQACNDLVGQFGITSNDCDQVKRALQAVEMDQAGTCSGLPASVPSCIDLEGF